MQQIFHTSASPEEYWQLGKEFAFPDPPGFCPVCRTGLRLKKHGFYRRNSLFGRGTRRILIRRYRCRFCGRTVSFLPSFCLPYFQYALNLIYQVLEYVVLTSFPLRRYVALFRELFKELYWEPAHLRFYVRRFLTVLPRLKLVLRQMFSFPGKETKGPRPQKCLMSWPALAISRPSPQSFTPNAATVSWPPSQISLAQERNGRLDPGEEKGGNTTFLWPGTGAGAMLESTRRTRA